MELNDEDREFLRQAQEMAKQRQQQLDKRCREFHARVDGAIDQWVQEVNDLSGVTGCDDNLDACAAMITQVIDELEATQDRTPERARALWMAIGSHYWMQRSLDAVLEGEA